MALFKNPTKRPITVVITHPDAPKTDVAFQQPVRDPESGELAARRVDRRLPESASLLGGEERELPGYAKKEALAAGLELVERKPESKGKPEGKPPPPQQPQQPQPAAAEAETPAQHAARAGKKRGAE